MDDNFRLFLSLFRLLSVFMDIVSEKNGLAKFRDV